MKVEFSVNGVEHCVEVEPNMRLIDVLRDKLRLTGVKEACGIGECGCCTVIMDHKAVNSCLVLAPQIRGKEIITVEGLEQDGKLDKLQESFIRHGAVQCGYCTSGMLMSAKALLNHHPDPTEEEIKTAIAGNLCRCTGYNKIITAIKEAAEECSHKAE